MKYLVVLFATQDIELDIVEGFDTDVPVLNAFLLEFEQYCLDFVCFDVKQEEIVHQHSRGLNDG